MKRYSLDLLNEKVYVDPSFAKKAGKFGSAEFNEYMALKEKLPGFKFEEKQLNAPKNTYKGLTNEVMEAFIMFYEPEENQKATLAEFHRVIAEGLLKSNNNSYPRSWFLSKYKDAYNKSSFAEKKTSKREEAIQNIRNNTMAQQEGGDHHG